MVTGIHDADSSYPEESLTRAGRTVGFLAEARVQAQGDPEIAEFGAKPLLDEAISYIPVAGDRIQQGVDYVTEKWLEDEQRSLDGQAAKENIARYEDRNKQLIALAEEWQEVHQKDGAPQYRPADKIEQAAEIGISRAQGISGGGTRG
uniref:hypothetical protein n=1 Tax=Streptomyces sp. CHD11 TaxID=2741325 RepID=UPI00203BDFC9|nr:hypothetical protein [Streptomyces sp. CHD11]